MINLFFVIHDHSGARTYANELLGYLSTQQGIAIHEVHLESSSYQEYTELKEESITSIHIPKVKRKINTLEKYAQRCIDLMAPLLRGKDNLIFHLNYSTQIKFGLEARSRFDAQIVYTLHYLPNYFSSFAMETVNPNEVTTTGDVLDKQIADKADRIICVTRFASEMLHQHYQTPQSKLHLIYNGSGSLSEKNSQQNKGSKEQLKQQLGFLPDNPIILFVGRLMHGKGVEKLITAFNSLCNDFPNIHLVLVGGGKPAPFMQLAQENIGRIIFTGKLPFEKVEQLYQLADMGVIPSDFEQCSYVALEMMKYQLPIVASDVPGMKELFTHKKDALLIPVTERKDGLLGRVSNLVYKNH